MDRPLNLADISADAVLIAGGARAILLQVANPEVGRGVAKHSDFVSRPMQRLQNTLTYLYALVYGTPDDIRRVTALVNSAHRPVEHAADGELQLWVAATLYDTAIQVRERIFGPLDPRSADRIYDEYRVIGTALQMPTELWPADRAAFAAYWSRAVAGLVVTDDARRVANDLLHARAVPWWIRLGMPLARLVTAGLLPQRLRADFGLPWGARRQKRFDRAMALIRWGYPRLPRAVRTLPRDRYLAKLRG
ncbi:MAG: hypothetical protein JWR53_1111 [Glaciihabitans sp.]|nr:hypothetical protein [Glaciihabitans sp.]